MQSTRMGKTQSIKERTYMSSIAIASRKNEINCNGLRILNQTLCEKLKQTQIELTETKKMLNKMIEMQKIKKFGDNLPI